MLQLNLLKFYFLFFMGISFILLTSCPPKMNPRQFIMDLYENKIIFLWIKTEVTTILEGTGYTV